MIHNNNDFTFTIDLQLDVLGQLRKFESTSKRRLADGFEQGRTVRELVIARARHIDSLLIGLWQYLQIQGAVSLIAVGGYGRGELHPHSDIDLLLLTDKKSNPENDEKLSIFITHLWDIGLIVGHATRNIKQCFELAKQDVSVVTNLMESRLLAGCPDNFSKITDLTAPKKMWSAKKFFEAKTEERKQRYDKFNGSSYDLEPNVKSSPGGLRDIQLIAWIAQRCYYPQSVFELITQKVITKKEYYTLMRCQLFLWRIRFALHMTSDKAEDRLLFDYQKKTAELMGYQDSDDMLGVEKMMKRYYRSVQVVRNISSILLQSLEYNLIENKTKKVIQPIDNDFQIINQRIDAIDPRIFSAKPFNLLRVFRLIAENPEIKGISAETHRAIRAARNKVGSNFLKSAENRNSFIQFWQIKHSTPRAIFSLKRSGVLSNYLPAFQQITGQMQYDMFHSYTVDEHTLFLLKNLIEFSNEQAKTDYPLCHEIMERQNKPELIYLAGLFHDIGKGRGGDHSEIGAIEALEFCQQHDFSPQDAETVSWLVANHLLMSLTAQKRDTSDPLVIKNFASLVQTPEKLELLYLLTVADIRATSRSLWNSWKDSLLKELAITTLAYLKNEQSYHLEPWEDTKQTALNVLLEQGYSEEWIDYYWQHLKAPYFLKNPADTIAWHNQCILKQVGITPSSESPSVIAIRKRVDGGGIEIFVYSRDVEDLFASLASTFAQHGLNVQGASIYTDDNGFCYDSFFTLSESGKPKMSQRNQQRLKDSIRENISQLESKNLPIQKRMARQIKHFKVNTEIVFSKDEYSPYTRLDIVAKDRPGLLSLLAEAFKSSDIRLHDARITTLGEKVEDTFIISDRDNSPVNNSDAQDRLTKAIRLELDD
ncbi:MAG: [protein-PII] uridylyltransferase [Kangiellaceae bacterium]|nr:[protein-PII] uridylyltransferase [Kangiellaceae bacterium]